MIKFNEFQSSNTASTADQLVGYANTSFGGERRWTVGTILSGTVTSSQNIAGATGTGSVVPSVTKSGSKLQFKKIKQGDGIVIADGTTDITITATGSVPTGAVMYFASASSPTGWIQCDGATIPNSGSTADLYAFLTSAGNPFGGAGKIPDLRGRFIRSFGTDSTVSPLVSSDAFGVKQADAFGQHTHSASGSNHSHGVSLRSNTTSIPGGNGYNYLNIWQGNGGGNTLNASVDVTVNNSGGTETRPVNLALLACIKL